MKCARGIALLMATGFALLAWPHFVAAQTCQDEETILEGSKKSLSELVATVKQESVTNFENLYHQKSAISELGFFGTAVDGMLDCLEKAAQDPGATKEATDASKAKHDTYAKLKEQLQHDHDALKDLSVSGQAKKYVEALSEVN